MNTESPTTAKPKRERTQAQKDAHAKRERERRAAAKGPQTIREAVQEREAAKIPVVIDGETYRVSAMMTPTERENAARLLHEAHVARQNGTADAPTPDVERVAPQDEPREPKPVKLKGDPHATVLYRLSRTAMEALEGKLGAEYRKANPQAWKVLKASKRVTGGQSWAWTGKLRPVDASALAVELRRIAGEDGFAKPGSLLTNAAKLESNHYVVKAAEKR